MFFSSRRRHTSRALVTGVQTCALPICAAVQWARQQLQQNSQAKLAIVVPELSALRDKLAALLDEAFHADYVTPQQAQFPRAYDFSPGVQIGPASCGGRVGQYVYSSVVAVALKHNQKPYIQKHKR